MYSTDFITALANWGMNVEMSRAQLAAQNIANFNKPGATAQTADFAAAIQAMSDAIDLRDTQAVNTHSREEINTQVTSMAQISLDAQVREMNDAEARFRMISEIYTRKAQLKSLVYSGGGQS